MKGCCRGSSPNSYDWTGEVTASFASEVIGEWACETIGLVTIGFSRFFDGLREGVRMSMESCWLDSVYGYCISFPGKTALCRCESPGAVFRVNGTNFNVGASAAEPRLRSTTCTLVLSVTEVLRIMNQLIMWKYYQQDVLWPITQRHIEPQLV